MHRFGPFQSPWIFSLFHACVNSTRVKYKGRTEGEDIMVLVGTQKIIELSVFTYIGVLLFLLLFPLPRGECGFFLESMDKGDWKESLGGLLRYSRSVDFSSLCLLISERAMASNHSSTTRGEWAPAGGQLLSFLVKWGFFREALLNYPGSDEVGPACSSHCWNQSWSNHPFKVSFLLTLLYQ